MECGIIAAVSYPIPKLYKSIILAFAFYLVHDLPVSGFSNERLFPNNFSNE
jgi:hypothetical protein